VAVQRPGQHPGPYDGDLRRRLGHLFDADIEINSSPTARPLTTQEPPDPSTIDLQAILTHEAGHFFGLAHATDESVVMYAYYSPGHIDLGGALIMDGRRASPPAPTQWSVRSGTRAGASRTLVQVYHPVVERCRREADHLADILWLELGALPKELRAIRIGGERATRRVVMSSGGTTPS